MSRDSSSPRQTAKRRKPNHLSNQAHRQLIGYLGVLLPVILLVLAGLRPTPGLPRWTPLESVSSYYYTGAVAAFVGTLVGLALFLFTYGGYEGYLADRVVAKIGGVCALGVAFFPTAAPPGLSEPVWWKDATRTIHYVSATLLFLVFIVFSLWLFRKGKGRGNGKGQGKGNGNGNGKGQGQGKGRGGSAAGGPPKGERERKNRRGRLSKGKRQRNRVYLICGLVMVANVLWAGSSYFTGAPIFWAETLALWAFAISWLVKGYAHKPVVETVKEVLKGASARPDGEPAADRPV